LIGQSRALDMILTGRPVPAEEAFSFGLANRIVPAGEARQAAEDLALSLTGFPQTCLKADRLSAHTQWSLPLNEALSAEGRGGERALNDEGTLGAGRFAGGLGRSGDFDKI
jgi:enoyl-CoA hydratase